MPVCARRNVSVIKLMINDVTSTRQMGYRGYGTLNKHSVPKKRPRSSPGARSVSLQIHVMSRLQSTLKSNDVRMCMWLERLFKEAESVVT